jgi:hypothetical protein
MDQYQDIVQTIALTLGVGWASGINLYATVFMLGFMNGAGYIDLPPGLENLSDPLVLLASGFMYCVEFFADKTPGVDTGWDALHTFIRIPAGAMLAAAAMSQTGGDASGASELAGAIVWGSLGGSLAAVSHFTKAGSRVLINTSPEPFTNWTASISEDVIVVGGLWTALNHPVAFLALLAAFIVLMIWLLPKLWRGIKKVFAALSRWFGGRNREPPGQVIAKPEEKP